MSEDLRELAYQDYMSGMKYKDIAEKYQVSINTVKSWKTRHKWDRSNKKGVHTKDKKGCTQKRGAPIGNKNATGGPPGNKKALKHGLFQKHLPPDCMEIFDAIETADPIDLLWDQIKIAYTNLIRSQQIMYVRDQRDTTKDKVVDGLESTVYNFQHAWEKQSNLLASQAKAQSVLKSMIKQYDELTRSSLATEEQRARIDKLKNEVARMNGDSDGKLEDLIKAVKDV
ncbi:phage terminase small subunit [Eubacteriaceae bacterium ES2]|nr:phage terminase small subunit [Eubacteriaceae bacterium ES2]